ncbi:hypothetical protein HN39_01980 [Listeria monocytogenes]|nr:hypothetical protein [Listeria monocytogenes]EAC6356332.1 hypothetical protein [Listeria monocytogenes]EAC7062861.1 hypothetical protein [Listeria monocytogenes]EAC7899141.1 hypothetical protein [Listeria monocytogenes]EAD7040764.1 hypothetical protein [Listeria monocytogenes]
MGDNRFINLEGEARVLSRWRLDKTWRPPVEKLSFITIDEQDYYTVQRALGLAPVHLEDDTLREQIQPGGNIKGHLVIATISLLIAIISLVYTLNS